jgi:hypothetical protein
LVGATPEHKGEGAVSPGMNDTISLENHSPIPCLPTNNPFTNLTPACLLRQQPLFMQTIAKLDRGLLLLKMAGRFS